MFSFAFSDALNRGHLVHSNCLDWHEITKQIMQASVINSAPIYYWVRRMLFIFVELKWQHLQMLKEKSETFPIRLVGIIYNLLWHWQFIIIWHEVLQMITNWIFEASFAIMCSLGLIIVHNLNTSTQFSNFPLLLKISWNFTTGNILYCTITKR